MNFDLTEEQVQLQDSLTSYLRASLPATKLMRIFDERDGFDEQLWQGLFELGIGSIVIPEAFGGLGLELLDLALVSEILGSFAYPGPFLGHTIATLALVLAGSDEQRGVWLPRLADGSAIGSFAFHESEDKFLPTEWTLSANDGRLSGTKKVVLGAEQAEIFIVGTAGGELALVTRDAEGLEIGKTEVLDRTRPFATLNFSATPFEPLPNGSPDIAEKLLDAALVLLSADSFGGATHVFDMSLDYAKTREKFGATIVNYQAIKHKLVDMTVSIEPTRGLYWYAAHSSDIGAADARHAASIAKAHITQQYMQLVRDSVELHGGIGFTWEYPLQVWFKRAMFNRNFLGQPAFHYDRAAAFRKW